MSSAVPLIPDTAPFSLEQRAWLNGFLAGVFSRSIAPAGSTVGGVPSPRETLTPLTILFGSQTGTAEGLAKKAAKEAGKRGFAPTVVDMAQATLASLAAEKNLLVITSTYGDGEPPDNAKALHTALASAAGSSLATAPLSSVRFSVCSLGDTNYTLFCQAGKDFDARLEKLGATRVSPRVDCDLDYETPYTQWLDTALAAFAPSSVAPTAAASAESETESGYSKKNPFPAPVLVVRNLNAAGSAKEVNHVEFSLADSGLTYVAGDALGVIPHNCPALVSDVLAALGCDGEESVPAADGSTTNLRHALTAHYDLGKPSPALLELCTLAPAAITTSNTPASAPHHVIDVLLASASKPSPTALVAALKKIQPRLYSISSSPKAHAGQVHLTVGAVRYEKMRARAKAFAPRSLPNAPSPTAPPASSSTRTTPSAHPLPATRR